MFIVVKILFHQRLKGKVTKLTRGENTSDEHYLAISTNLNMGKQFALSIRRIQLLPYALLNSYPRTLLLRKIPKFFKE